MDVKDIVPFFDMFLTQPSFSVEEVTELLGEKEDDSLPGRIVLKPKSREVVSAQLELFPVSKEGTGARDKLILAGIAVEFARQHAPRVSFSGLTAKYGKPQQLPLPPPVLLPGGIYQANFSYAFGARREALEGSLIVTVDGERQGDLNRVIKVIYRRFLR